MMVWIDTPFLKYKIAVSLGGLKKPGMSCITICASFQHIEVFLQALHGGVLGQSNSNCAQQPIQTTANEHTPRQIKEWKK